MKIQELRQIIREEISNIQLENKTPKYKFTFSEYDSELPEEIREYVISSLKSKYPNLDDDIIEEYIAELEDYHYEEARHENKLDRDYPEISVKDFIEEIVYNLEENEEVETESNINENKLTSQQKSDIDKALIGLKKKAGPEYKKAATTIVMMAQEVTGDETIRTPKQALLALDYEEPTIR